MNGVKGKIWERNGIVQAAYSDAIDVSGKQSFSIQVDWDVKTPTAKEFYSGVAEVQTLTFDTQENTGNGDYVIVYAGDGTAYAAFADKSDVAVQTLTFPAKSSLADGDYIVFYASDGTAYAVAVDLTGSSAAPTGSTWEAIASASKAQADLSAASTAAEVAAAFETAIDGITGLSDKITTSDAANDGTMTLTQVVQGTVSNILVKKADGSPATSISSDNTTAGTDVTPSGALYTAVASANKVRVNISADETAAEVAASFEAALNAIDGFSDKITSDDTADDGTMTLTQVSLLAAEDTVVKNADDSGDGSITVEETTPGVSCSINLENENITIPAHGFYTGQKGQVTTSDEDLPAGISATTDYFVIKIDDDTIALASSLVNANAGTAINITDLGTGTHTFTPTALAGASIKPQRSNNGITFYDDSDMASQNITADGGYMWEKKNNSYAYVRLAIAISAGEIDIDAHLSAVS